MSNSNGYIFKRETSDDGPYGSTYAYYRVTQPAPGETIYHGKFAPVQVNCGQYDADTCTVYQPVGPITEEKFQDNTETF